MKVSPCQIKPKDGIFCIAKQHKTECIAKQQAANAFAVHCCECGVNESARNQNSIRRTGNFGKRVEAYTLTPEQGLNVAMIE